MTDINQLRWSQSTPAFPNVFFHGELGSSPQNVFNAANPGALVIVTCIDGTFASNEASGKGINVGAYSSTQWFFSATSTGSFGSYFQWRGELVLYYGAPMYALWTAVTPPYLFISGYVTPALNPQIPT